LRLRLASGGPCNPPAVLHGPEQTLRICGLRCFVAKFFVRVDVTEEFPFLGHEVVAVLGSLNVKV